MIVVLLLVTLAPAAAEAQSPLERLLRLRYDGRVAHVLADPDLFNRGFSSDFRDVNRGRISRSTPAERRRRFGEYFRSVRFLEWDDVRPPVVTLSPAGDWAEVIVEKRVRYIPADPLSADRESAVRYAWTERWARMDTSWQLSTVVSTERPEPDSFPAPLAARRTAFDLLRRSRQALGGDSAVQRVPAVRFVAECEGPRGTFRTTIASARDGRVLFDQEFPSRPRSRSAIALARRWQSTGGSVVDSLDAVAESITRAHEVHLLALSPESRYTAPVARRDTLLDGRLVNVVEFRDALGAPIAFFYDAQSGRPAGFQPLNQAGDDARTIVFRWDDWRKVGDVLLPYSITITQGTDVYRYRVTEATTGWLPDTVFQP
jgi:hypothetical protein